MPILSVLSDQKNILRFLSPKIMIEAFRTFDRHTIILTSVCWASALAALLIAAYTLWLAGSIKRDLVTAQAMEPALPVVTMDALDKKGLTEVQERLKKRYPELTYKLIGDRNLQISSADGALFQSWLTCLNYIETVTPQVHWTIRELCAGAKCPAGEGIMRAILVAEKASFSIPQTK